MQKGDIVYFLSEYEWLEGEISTNPKAGAKTLQVARYPPGSNLILYKQRVPVEKVAKPGECVAVVWETWKGTNGRGGYRVERELYPEHRVPAEKVSIIATGTSGRLEEEDYGILRAPAPYC